MAVEEVLSGTSAYHSKDVINEEYIVLLKYKPRELTTLSLNKRTSSFKWVFNSKTNQKDETVKYKARKHEYEK